MSNERKYKTLVTATGKNKIAAAVEGGGTINITKAAVGDGGGEYYEPSADMTALVHEVWRGNIADKWINESSSNMADVKVILPADVGGFTVREAALFDDAGDMIAICNIPDTEKAVITTGAAGTLTIVIHIVLTDADAVEFTIDPQLDVMTAADVDRRLSRHNEDTQAHADIRERIEQALASATVIISETPPEKGPALWFCDGDYTPPLESMEATLILGDEGDTSPVQVEVDGQDYPATNASLEDNADGEAVVTIS